MPLIVKDEDVTWNETLDRVNVVVPLPDRYLQSVSITTASQYLKVSSPPYIWECVLPHAIEADDGSVARIENGAVCFELLKREKLNWGQIKHTNSKDKIFRRQCREEAMQEIEKRINESSEAKSALKFKKEREAVRKQMEIDDLERTWAEEAKLLEKRKLSEEIAKMKIWQDMASLKKENEAISLIENAANVTPLPRQCGIIDVTFTPRVFPSAARESQEIEEQQWLEKQAAACKNLDLDTSDLSSKEKNPAWLEKKGNDLCQKGDFSAAINAYTLAILMNPTSFTAYGNRAVCQLKLENFLEAVKDSSRALEFLNPPVPSNSEYRFKNYVCRGKAYFALESHVKSLIDLEAALRIDSTYCDIKEMADKVRKIIESS